MPSSPAPRSGRAANSRLSYSDSVVESRRLNALLLFFNNFVGFLYRNMMNAPLMSTNKPGDSATTRSSIKRTTKRDKIAAERAARIPRRRGHLFRLLILVETIILIRFVGLAIYLSDYYPTKALVSHAQPIVSMRYGSTRLPVRLAAAPTNSTRSYVETEAYGLNLTADELECTRKLEELYTARYGDFYVWNASADLLASPPGGLLTYFLVLEQLPAVQMMRKEASIYNYLMSCVIVTSLIFGSWLASRSPYDITSLVFIYEPALIARPIELRAARYLRVIRQSYTNFWQAYSLDSGSGLVGRHHFSAWNRQLDTRAKAGQSFDSRKSAFHGDIELASAHGQSAIIERYNFDATLSAFKAYIPSARRQAWRRVLIIMHPIGELALGGAIIDWTICAWLWVVYRVDFGVNASTRLALAATNQTANRLLAAETLEALATGEPCRRRAGLVEASGHLAVQSIVNNYGSCLHDRACDTSQYDTKSQCDTKSVLDSLQPIEAPHILHYTETLICHCFAITIVILYMMLLLITVLDLCFWLAELRFKLNVCTCLLRRNGTHRAQSSQAAGLGLRACDTANRATSRETRAFDDVRPRLKITDGECHAAKRGGAPTQVTISRVDDHDSSLADCNIAMRLTRDFLLANRAEKERLSERYARALLALDEQCATNAARALYNPRAVTDKFLVSTYLDFRLFLDQINNCRLSMKFIMGFVLLNTLNVITATSWMGDAVIKLGCFIGGLSLANLGLGSGALFQSQCSKLHAPIHTALALCTRGDCMTRHLALLWRRSLLDFAGSKSKFSFGFYSIEINYATMLQFNLSVVSVYILLLDKDRFGA